MKQQVSPKRQKIPTFSGVTVGRTCSAIRGMVRRSACREHHGRNCLGNGTQMASNHEHLKNEKKKTMWLSVCKRNIPIELPLLVGKDGVGFYG
jgi:hypothetical protein